MSSASPPNFKTSPPKRSTSAIIPVNTPVSSDVSSSAPSRPIDASRSDSRVKPERSAETSVPSKSTGADVGRPRPQAAGGHTAAASPLQLQRTRVPRDVQPAAGIGHFYFKTNGADTRASKFPSRRSTACAVPIRASSRSAAVGSGRGCRCTDPALNRKSKPLLELPWKFGEGSCRGSRMSCAHAVSVMFGDERLWPAASHSCTLMTTVPPSDCGFVESYPRQIGSRPSRSRSRSWRCRRHRARSRRTRACPASCRSAAPVATVPTQLAMPEPPVPSLQENAAATFWPGAYEAPFVGDVIVTLGAWRSTLKVMPVPAVMQCASRSQTCWVDSGAARVLSVGATEVDEREDRRRADRESDAVVGRGAVHGDVRAVPRRLVRQRAADARRRRVDRDPAAPVAELFLATSRDEYVTVEPPSPDGVTFTSAVARVHGRRRRRERAGRCVRDRSDVGTVVSVVAHEVQVDRAAVPRVVRRVLGRRTRAGLDRSRDRRCLLVDLEDERTDGDAVVQAVAHLVRPGRRGRRLRVLRHGRPA